MAEHYRSLRVFVSLGELQSRTGITNDFQPAASAANHAEVQESKVLGMPRTTAQRAAGNVENGAAEDSS